MDAAARRSSLLPWTQLDMVTVSLASRYILIVAATFVFPRVSFTQEESSLTEIRNLASRPRSLHQQMCIVYSSLTMQKSHFGECVPLLQ
jgi:hypothetical protein